MAKPGREVRVEARGLETIGVVTATTAWHTAVVCSDGEVNVRFAPVSGPTQQLQALLS
jgi:hypothetical protein